MQRINQWIIEEAEAESLNNILEGKTKKLRIKDWFPVALMQNKLC